MKNRPALARAFVPALAQRFSLERLVERDRSRYEGLLPRSHPSPARAGASG